MIRKSGNRLSLATNAKHLRGGHAQTKKWTGMTIRRKVIPVQVFSNTSLVLAQSDREFWYFGSTA
jgi:hypothetical protein